MSIRRAVPIGLCVWALAATWSLLGGERVRPHALPTGTSAPPALSAAHGISPTTATLHASAPHLGRAASEGAFTGASHLQAGSGAPEPTDLEAIERDLLERVRDVLPAGSALRSLECKHAACRLESDHADAEGLRTFVNELAVMDLDPSHPFAGAVDLIVESSPQRADLRQVAIAYFRPYSH